MKSKSFNSSTIQDPDPQESSKCAASALQPASCCGRSACKAGILFTGLALGVLGISFVSGCIDGALSENTAVPDTATNLSLPEVPLGEGAPATVGSEIAAPTNPGPVWQENFQQALARAAEQGKPVLLRFSAAWCTPCRVMDSTVWVDEQVKSTLANQAVPVEIDIDQEANAGVVQRYGIRSIPTILLIDANGEELARGGFMSAEAMVEFLNQS